MQAKMLVQNEQTRHLLKLVLKGALDGNITEEDCQRLGMTEAEIRDYIRQIKQGEEEGDQALKKIEESVKLLNKVDFENEKASLKSQIAQLQDDSKSRVGMDRIFVNNTPIMIKDSGDAGKLDWQQKA